LEGKRDSQISRKSESRVGIAMQAAATLSRTAGAGGSNIEEVLTTADRLVEENCKSKFQRTEMMCLYKRGVLLFVVCRDK